MAPSEPVTRILARLDNVRPRQGYYIARCPAHEDRVQSLTVGEGAEGRVLIKCHAGCATSDIVEGMGLEMTDLFTERERTYSSPIAYEIRDQQGALVAIHERSEGPSGKRFTWKQPNGEYGLGGLRATDLPLFGSEKVKDWAPDIPIVLVEGEKAAGALHGAGIPALGTVGGAATTPSPGALSILGGRKVLLWPDNDDPGREHMAKIGKLLQDLAVVAEVSWNNAPSRGDAADFVLQMSGPDELRALFNNARAFAVKRIGVGLDEFIRISQVKHPWVIPGIVPDIGITFFVGEPRSFKTMAALQALLCTAGEHPFLGRMPERTGSVLYLSGEGSATRIAERLRNMSAVIPAKNQVSIIHRKGITLTDKGFIPVYEELDEMEDPCLIVVDTLANMMVGDENTVEASREALRPLHKAIGDFGVSVIVIHHVNKSTEGRVGKRLRGSSAFWGASDAVVEFRRKIGEDGSEYEEGSITAEPKDGDPSWLRFYWDRNTFLLRLDTTHE